MTNSQFSLYNLLKRVLDGWILHSMNAAAAVQHEVAGGGCGLWTPHSSIVMKKAGEIWTHIEDTYSRKGGHGVAQ